MICPNCKGMVGNDAATCPKCGHLFVSNLSDEQLEKRRKLQEKKKKMILTTTNLIEGYEIISYLGIVSGEYALGTGFLSELNSSTADFFGTESGAFSSKLGLAKSNSIARMRDNALQFGADAVVGVDIDILNTNSNVFIACANGTAVKIRKKGEQSNE